MTKAEFVLSDLQQSLRQGLPALRTRQHFSKRGTPMLLVTDSQGVTYSITYFAKQRELRAHWPWASDAQEKQRVATFKTYHLIAPWFAKHEAKALGLTPLALDEAGVQRLLAQGKKQFRFPLSTPEEVKQKLLTTKSLEGHVETGDLNEVAQRVAMWGGKARFFTSKYHGIIAAVDVPYQVGQQLYVQESFLIGQGVGGYQPGVDPDANPDGPTVDIIYKADGDLTAGPWLPAESMTPEQSRIILEVTSVKAQWLQDLTEADAQAEGHSRPILEKGPVLGSFAGVEQRGHPMTGAYRDAFAAHWNATQGQQPGLSWDDNPIVWAVTFKQVQPASAT